MVRTESMCGWHEVVEGLFTQPKRRLASFAGYFPRGNRGDEGVDLDLSRILLLKLTAPKHGGVPRILVSKVKI